MGLAGSSTPTRCSASGAPEDIEPTALAFTTAGIQAAQPSGALGESTGAMQSTVDQARASPDRGTVAELMRSRAHHCLDEEHAETGTWDGAKARAQASHRN